MGYDLWPRPFQLRSFARKTMRLSDDVRSTVGFIGFKNGEDFRAVGTAFLVNYQGCGYLVTNNHIAHGIGDDPFAIRFSDTEGNTANVLADPLDGELRWFTSHDSTVDLAIASFNVDFASVPCKAFYLREDMLLSDEMINSNGVGAGDICYAVGLFRLLAGKNRNVTFVHSGNIGAMASDERVPTTNWTDKSQTVLTEAHLVEMTNLKGLSGSPVFVRPSMIYRDIETDKGPFSAIIARNDFFLLGIWQSSWDAKPEDAVLVDNGSAARVPVGVGVVVPTKKLLEILNMDEVVKARETRKKKWEAASAAKLDTVTSP